MAKWVVLFLLSSVGFAEGEIVLKDDQVWKELDLSALAKSVSRTKSKSGFAQFEKLLQPVSHVEQLRYRQSIVRELLKDENFEALSRMNAEFADEHEETLKHFLDQSLHVKILSEAESSWFLQKPSIKIQLLAGTLSAAMFVQYFLFSWRNLKAGLASIRDAGLGVQRWVWWNVFAERFALFYSAWMLANSQVEIYTKLAKAHEQVLKARKLFELVHQTNRFLQKSVVLHRTEFGIKLAALSKKLKEDPDIEEGILGWFSGVDVYDVIRNSPHTLSNIKDVFGELDAFMSVARLHREGRWVFANYDQGVDSEFDFKELSNPLIKDSVVNDFRLGSERHWVLTGPHACGKTTSMRSIAYGFILGQSIGIVPAKFARFSPVSKIATYMNIADSIVDGKSSFVAEHRRMSELEELSQNMKPGKLVLMLIDEPYAKTIQMVGEPMVVEFLNKVKDVKGLNVILATHFEAPSRIGGLVENYQPEIDSELRPTFKIIPGAAKWWFEDAAKRERFIRRYITKLGS